MKGKSWGGEIRSVLWRKVRMFSSFSPAVPDKQRLTGYQMTCSRILNAISPSDSA